MSGPTPGDVLRLWFGAPGSPEAAAERAVWWRPDPSFDALLRERLGEAHHLALAGALDGWRATAEGSLALVLLLDQLSRNLYRGEARAFAGDARALVAARDALDRGLDARLPPLQRLFLYMPFMHAERREDQERSVALFDALARELPEVDHRRFAIRHRDIVARFGRFPHRNAALGRSTTAEEAGFLRQPGSSF